MGRIDTIFRDARGLAGGRARLVLPFITGGYPNVEALPNQLEAAARGGAKIIEIGIPFSDPIADGPVIAASMHEALGRGATPQRIFDAVATARRERPRVADLGIVAMTSISIVHRIGVERFLDRLSAAGFDGVIVPDVDLDLAPTIAAGCDRRTLSASFLVAPTTGPERLAPIVAACRGFVYLLARAGVTGVSSGLPDLAAQAARIRALRPDLPIAAGFGIATRAQVEAALADVDGAIVGSALVQAITAANDDGSAAIEALVRSLVGA
jgi:tryptophan synthase alpha chain